LIRQKINPKTVAHFLSTTQATTIHHRSTTNSPQIHHKKTTQKTRNPMKIATSTIANI